MIVEDVLILVLELVTLVSLDILYKVNFEEMLGSIQSELILL